MVLLPLTMGGLASTGLLCLVLSWNEAFWSLILRGEPRVPDLDGAADRVLRGPERGGLPGQRVVAAARGAARALLGVRVRRGERERQLDAAQRRIEPAYYAPSEVLAQARQALSPCS